MEQSESRPERPFLEALVGDLEPVRPATSWLLTAVAWLLLALGLVSLGILFTGPLRAGALSDLGVNGFAVEMALGMAAAFSLIWAGLEIGVPGSPDRRLLLAPPLIFVLVWLAVTGFDLTAFTAHPAHSMIGKREHCFIQGIAISLIPIAPTLAILRRRALYSFATSGFLVGTAAAALTTLWMQIACMYEPAHAMRFHFTPLLVAGALGSLLAHVLRPRT